MEDQSSAASSPTPRPGSSIPEGEQADDLRGHLMALYAAYLREGHAAQNYLAGFLRRHKTLRGSARNFLGAAFFGLLRRRLRLLLLARGCTSPLSLDDLAIARLTQDLPLEEEAIFAIWRWLREDLGADADKATQLTIQAIRWAVRATGPGASKRWPMPDPARTLIGQFQMRHEKDPELRDCPDVARSAAEVSLPPMLLARWATRFDIEPMLALARSMGSPAPLDVRASRHAGGRNRALAVLKEAGIAAETCRFAPDGIRLLRKHHLPSIPGWDALGCQIQEEGSQLVSLALDPPANAQILDACAGAGGKSLHLYDLAPRATIWAHDTDEIRLTTLKERIAGDSSISGRFKIHQPGNAASAAPYDSVLIDAPCLGLGRLRRDPEVAWWAEAPGRIEEVTASQRACIEQYAPLVATGGILVYAICSFEPEETTGLLASIPCLAEDFQPDPLPALFDHPDLAKRRSADRSQITLLPSEHGTDGFFIARFRRK